MTLWYTDFLQRSQENEENLGNNAWTPRRHISVTKCKSVDASRRLGFKKN